MKFIFILLVVFFIVTLGFVIAWEGHRKQIRTPVSALVGGGIILSICGLLIHYFANSSAGVGAILLFRSINVGSALVASGYGVILGGILLGLVRFLASLKGRVPKD